MTLSSVIFLRKCNNISIIGCNITVFCTNGGGLYFKYSNNLTIEGITWFRCGRSYGPVISIDPSYGVLIQNCNFQNSVKQAILLSNVIEVANINHCNFINNNGHIDHGAAILSKLSYNIAFIYISNCNFSYNGEAKSIVAFEYSHHLSFVHIHIYFNNSNFYNNQGVSVYLLRGCILHINGEVLFKNNMAENSAGIYISDHSTVIYDESTNSKFVNNSVHYNGAVIFLKCHSKVTFQKNSRVFFTDNKARNGIIYSEASSNVIFKANCKVEFGSNLVTQHGAAIYSIDKSHVTFTGN